MGDEWIDNLIVGIETTLGNCATFISWTGATDAADAAENYIHQAETKADCPTPCALIHDLDGIALLQPALGAQVPDGECRVTLIGRIQDAQMDQDGRIVDWKTAIKDLNQKASLISLEMTALALAGGYGANMIDVVIDKPQEFDHQTRRSLGMTHGMNECSRDLLITLGFRPPTIG